MRYFAYSEPGGERGEIIDTYYITEEEILDEYWEFWKDLMVRKYGDGPNEIIKPENALNEWIADHNAYEIDEEHYRIMTKKKEIEWCPTYHFRWLNRKVALGYYQNVLQQKYVPKYSKLEDVYEGKTEEKWIDVPTVTEEE